MNSCCNCSKRVFGIHEVRELFVWNNQSRWHLNVVCHSRLHNCVVLSFVYFLYSSSKLNLSNLLIDPYPSYTLCRSRRESRRLMTKEWCDLEKYIYVTWDSNTFWDDNFQTKNMSQLFHSTKLNTRRLFIKSKKITHFHEYKPIWLYIKFTS